MAASDSPSTLTQQRQQVAAGGETYIYPMSLHEHEEVVEMKDFVRFTAYKGEQPGYTTMQTRGTAVDLEKIGSVTLHLPENIENSTKSQFEGADSGALGLMGKTGAVAGEDNGFLDKVLNLGGELSLSATQFAGGLAFGGDGNLQSQVIGGRVSGANKHMLFRGIDFRAFNYQYSILPRSAKESIEINNMIKFLRKNMLPEMTGLNFFQVPNTFTVEYYLGGRPAEFLHKIKPCVLTD